MSSNHIRPFCDPYNNIFEDSDNELLSPFDPLDDSWSLYQEMLQSPIAPANIVDQIINVTTTTSVEAVHVDEQQQHLATVQEQDAEIILGNGLELMRISTSKSNTIRKRNRKINNNEDGEEGPSPSSVPKKLDHNAKERIRRMKLNASYLALRALLPDHSRRSKKRCSAPAMVDRALKYIPELENEIEELRSKKENIIQSAPKNKNTIANHENPTSESYENPTVSITKVDKEEAIIQTCMARKLGDEDGLSAAFTNLLQSVEDEDICIKSVSSVYVCESRICYNLHIQMNQSPSKDDCIEELRDKVISWLK